MNYLIPKTAQGVFTFIDGIRGDSRSEASDETFRGADDVLGVFINFFMGVAWSFTFVFIIVNGIKIMSSQGDPKAYAQAKNGLMYSIVAMLLVLAAFVIKNIILDNIGVSDSNITNEVPNF